VINVPFITQRTSHAGKRFLSRNAESARATVRAAARSTMRV